MREFQQKISDALNSVEALVQGDCKAFAEDTMDLGYEIGRTLNDGGVTVVVVTPRLQRHSQREGRAPSRPHSPRAVALGSVASALTRSVTSRPTRRATPTAPCR